MCEAGGLAERGQSVNDMSSHLWRVLALPLGFGRTVWALVAPPASSSETLAALGRTV